MQFQSLLLDSDLFDVYQQQSMLQRVALDRRVSPADIHPALQLGASPGACCFGFSSNFEDVHLKAFSTKEHL